MTKLNQIIAIEKDVRAKAERVREGAMLDVAKAGPLSGLDRTYRPRADDGDRLPAESTRVQYTAEHITQRLANSLSRLWDVTATKDKANTQASADVVVEGEVLLADVPVSFLVWFEKQLAQLRAFLVRLPVLDPAEEWTFDEATAVYRSAPAVTTRTRKVPNNHVLAEATDKHPAQVQVYMTDEPEGDWTTTKFSGAMPQARVSDLVERLDKLTEAVKFAREEANQHTVDDVTVGEFVFEYLLA